MRRKPRKEQMQGPVEKDRCDKLKNKQTEQRASKDVVTQAESREFKRKPAVSDVGAAVRLQSDWTQPVSKAGPLPAS